MKNKGKTRSQPTPIQRPPPSTAKRFQGRPRKDLKLEETALHYLIWPGFRRLLRKSKKMSSLWAAVDGKRDYFICLSTVAFFTPESEFFKMCLVTCFKVAPDLTCMVIPRLRRSAAKIDFTGKHRAAVSNPPEEDSKRLDKISAQDADLRRRIREAVPDFMARTAD